MQTDKYFSPVLVRGCKATLIVRLTEVNCSQHGQGLEEAKATSLLYNVVEAWKMRKRH